ncbi:MAG: hypothetical protein F4W92_09050 [Gammaproteobacteria bacterium]|nr:hypothetical protein [Gammaproteobacteria bacterium]
MKKSKIIGIIVACLAFCGLVGVAVSLWAQDDGTEDDGCRWHLEHSPKGAADNFSVSTLVNALYWNDCTGAVYFIQGVANFDGTGSTSAEEIDLP